MKTNVKFILGVMLLMAVVLVIEYQMPRRFSWEVTFGHHDDQPFGCMVMDSVLSVSMPKGYEVQKRTFRHLLKDSTLKEPMGIVALTNQMVEWDLDAYKLAERGHVVLLGCEGMTSRLEDTLGIRMSWEKVFMLDKITGQDVKRGRLKWMERDGGYPYSGSGFPVYHHFIGHRIVPDSQTVCTPLWVFERPNPVEDDDTCVVAVACPVGKGELILLSAPLLMTNYTMLDGDNAAIIGRLMNRMKDRHVIRTESYMEVTAHDQTSPLYVFLQRPPLRWAIYMTVLTILLFMVFTARRRQRAIPVVTAPKNRNLEFVKLIGTLYWQERNHSDLIKKKLNYTAEEVRRQTGIDILDEASMKKNVGQLARVTGMEEERLNDIVMNAKIASTGMYDISDKELKAHIADLNEMTQNL